MTQDLVYAGIGSRATPLDIRRLINRAAYAFHRSGWTLRTGGAIGADTAFLAGCLDAAGCGGPTRYELYLPWPGFTDVAPPTLEGPTTAAYNIAARHHPEWRNLGPGAKRLLARDVHQILGRDCDHPVKMVVCWTPDGSLTGDSRESGGTGMALRVAREHAPNAIVFNLAREEHRSRIAGLIDQASRGTKDGGQHDDG